MPTTETQKELDAVLHYTERVGTKSPENNPFKRANEMLLRAEATWPVIAQEEGGLKEAFLPYMVVVGLLPGLIGSALGGALLGTMGARFGRAYAPAGMTSLVVGSAIHFAFGMFGILVAAKIVELIAPSFGLRKSWVLSARALVYGSTPVFVAGVIIWIPFLGGLVGFISMIWSLLLTFRGLKALLAKPSVPKIDVVQEKSEVPELASV